MRLTVRDNVCNAILIPGIRFTLVEQHGSRAVCDETPILHGTHSLKRHSKPRLHLQKRTNLVTYKFMDSKKVCLG